MNARTMSSLILMLAVGTVAAQPTVYVSPDVPTTPDGATYLPWEVIKHDPGGAPYSLEFVLLGRPAIDALHKMDAPGNWLFSFDAPTDLGGVLASVAEPRDVIRYEAGPYSVFFDGDCVTPAVPAGKRNKRGFRRNFEYCGAQSPIKSTNPKPPSRPSRPRRQP